MSSRPKQQCVQVIDFIGPAYEDLTEKDKEKVFKGNFWDQNSW